MSSVVADTAGPRDHLQRRLAGLRRRWYLVVCLRGLGLLIAVLAGIALGAGLLDWRYHLPSAVRAFFLTGGLGLAGIVAYRFLLRPMQTRADDLFLALRIEKHYPQLNDSLASTVQFLEEVDANGSPALRRQAIRQGLDGLENCDIRQVVDCRGLGLVCFLALLGLTGVVGITAWLPVLAGVALQRLADPFGIHDWPRQTRLEVEIPRTRIGRNEFFEINGRAWGVVPPTARVVFKHGRILLTERTCEVMPAEDGQSGTFRCRLEAGKVQGDFQVQVRAHDAQSPWYSIAVLPPPVLVPLEDRASPQVHLQFPAYTDLPEQDLPDGTGNLEAVTGTVATLRAAADRPLSAAWIEYLPEPRHAETALALGLLGAAHPAGALVLEAGGLSVRGRIPAVLTPDRCAFTVAFRPPLSGMYALHIEDENTLHNSRLFELRIFPDPAPRVTLERPSPGQDQLTVLPDATLSLQVLAEDPQFALRSVFLEYRCQKSEGKPRRLPLYDHPGSPDILEQALAFLTGREPVLPPLRSGVKQLSLARSLDLEGFRHLDPAGGKLKEGDVLVLQAAADDFDDVAVDKQPGRSHEVEIFIVSRNALDFHLNQAQARIQQELVVLHKLQTDALGKVRETEAQLKKTDRLNSPDIDRLLQAEQWQQQIRERIGSQQEGLRLEVHRILETLRQNHLPRTAAQERMEAVDRELERLAQEELPQVEPLLTNARKPNGNVRSLLGEARQHQEEVEKTLGSLLNRLEPWTSTQEIKGEAKILLEEQRRLQQQTEDIQQKELGKRDEKPLDPPPSSLLPRLQAEQHKLEERTGQLLDRMDRVAQERKDRDPKTAEELEAAAQQGRQGNIVGLMQEARQRLQQNQLSQASNKQGESAQQLQKLVQTLEDRREAELERLIKKVRDQEKSLADLEEQQERLRQKVKRAQEIADPNQRSEELKKLARQQEKLQQQAEDLLRQLSRQGTEPARRALEAAAERMQTAGRQLQEGQAQEELQEEALDRLAQARNELEQTRMQAEEELAREQLTKLADDIKRFLQRQEALLTENARIQKELLLNKPEQWRSLLISLGRLADAQGQGENGLAGEVNRQAQKHLDQSPVFSRALRTCAQVMDGAARHLVEHRDHVNTTGQPESVPGSQAQKEQEEAVHRLNQLLEVLQDAEKAGALPTPKDKEKGTQQGEGDQPPPGSNGIPQVAELKLLRQMQAEVNRKTSAFRQKYPDLGKLDEKALAELQDLQRQQQEIAELLEGLRQKDEGGRIKDEEEGRRNEGGGLKDKQEEIFPPSSFLLPPSSLIPPFLAQETPDEPPIRLKKKLRPGEESRDVAGKETPRGPGPPIEQKPVQPPGDPKEKPEPPPDDHPDPDEQEVLNRIDKNMRTSMDRLANRELNDRTEQVQDDIVKDLDQLIKRLQNPNRDSDQAREQQSGTQSDPKPEQKQTTSSRGPGKNRLQGTRSPGRRGNRPSPQLAQGQRPQGANPQAPGNKPGRPNPERQVQGGDKPGAGTGSSQGEANKLTEIYKEIWGHLPETLRAEMNAYGREQFMEKYSELIRQYYRTIAEKGRRKE